MNAPAVPSPPRQRAPARREAVLAAAALEFAEGGLAGTSTEAIAARAGISQPYVFRLFGSKRALFLAVVERGFDRTLEVFQAAAGPRPDDNVWAAMGFAYLELLRDRTALLVQLHTYAACEDAEVRATCRRKFGELYEWLETLPGGSPELVNAFVARGMLLNVSAAMDLPALATSSGWAGRCLLPTA